MDIRYSFCIVLSTSSAEVADMKFRRADYQLLEANGQTYRSWSDTRLVGQTLSLGRGQCFDGIDLDLSRPAAEQFRMTFEFGTDGQPAISRVFTGKVISQVPPLPFITGVTLTEDIDHPQNLLFQPRPIRFTAHVEGGTPPFQYQFRINGFLLRDWSTDSVFVWEGMSLNNQPIVSGGVTATVNVRRVGVTFTEWTTSVAFGYFLF